MDEQRLQYQQFGARRPPYINDPTGTSMRVAMAWETPEDTGIGKKKSINKPVATYVMQGGQNDQTKQKTFVPRDKYFQRSP